MKRLLGCLILFLCLPTLTSLLAQSGDSGALHRFQYFVGEWTGKETGSPGIGKGRRTYRYILQNRYLHGENQSVFEPQEKNPTGEVHDDWTVFSFDTARKTVIVRQFNSEGFVNRLVLQDPENEKELVFVSEASENAPPGLRVRLSYRILNENEFAETFELARPGQDFAGLLENHWTRVTGKKQ